VIAELLVIELITHTVQTCLFFITFDTTH